MMRVYRFYGGRVRAQERWLNKMAEQGYKLVGTTKATYEFMKCCVEEYQYKVEYVGHMSKEKIDDYIIFLHDLGYATFFKNASIDYSVGKVEFRPWAEKGGRVATGKTTLHRELLIVEKKADGKPFDLHTTYEDQLGYYRSMRKPWLFLLLLFLILWLAFNSVVCLAFGAFFLLSIIPILL